MVADVAQPARTRIQGSVRNPQAHRASSGVVRACVCPEVDFLYRDLFDDNESYCLHNDPIIKNRAEGYEVRRGELINDSATSMAIPCWPVLSDRASSIS